MTFLGRPRGLALAAAGTLFLLLGSACSAIENHSGNNDDGTTPGETSTSTAIPEATATTNTSVQPGDTLSTTELVDLAQPSVVRVASQAGVGSGFVVNPDGYIVTNYHVIEGAGSILEVTLADGSVLDAEVVGADARSDLAVLKVDAGHDLPALSLATLADVHVGDDVVAIGYALDLAAGRGDPSVTRGIVSAKNRPINDSGILGAVQTDAAINHGNSGGPLINYQGQVVGVNTALAPDTSTQGLAQNIGFAIGSDTVSAVYDEIRETKQVQRGYLGISDFSSLRAAAAKALGIPEDQPGILIPQNGVAAGGPAATAGIRGNDVIVEIDGAPVGDESDLWVSMIRHNPGDTVEVKVYRDGKLLALDVTLGTAPTS